MRWVGFKHQIWGFSPRVWSDNLVLGLRFGRNCGQCCSIRGVKIRDSAGFGGIGSLGEKSRGLRGLIKSLGL